MYETMWKCDELNFIFSPSDGGYKIKKQTSVLLRQIGDAETQSPGGGAETQPPETCGNPSIPAGSYYCTQVAYKSILQRQTTALLGGQGYVRGGVLPFWRPGLS